MKQKSGSDPQLQYPPSLASLPSHCSTNQLSGIDLQDGSDTVGYRLQIRQQPHAALSCDLAEKNWKVIDPPPIIQLLVEGPDLIKDEITKISRYPYYVMTCSILDASESSDGTFIPEEQRQQRRLAGGRVSCPLVCKDDHHDEGCFFYFPDLSCGVSGSSRLKFSLAKINPKSAQEVKVFPVLASVQSEPFTVYTVEEFPGVQTSSELTKRLQENKVAPFLLKGQ
jgi:hypothetical protein